MSQQINLINPALIKQKDFLTVVNMGVIYGVMSVLMLGWYAYSAWQVNALTQVQLSLAAEIPKIEAELAQLLVSRAPRSPDPALLQQLALLESKQQVQAQMLNAIQQRKPQADRGLANYMRGFARQTMDGLWLTGFAIDEANKTMTVRGRSLEAEYLPAYVQKLAKEPVFAGKHFGGLRIKQTEDSDAQPLARPVSPESVGRANAGAVALPLFIEFELQGLEWLPMQTTAKPTSEALS